MTRTHCVYCGWSFQCRDHFIPVSYKSVYRTYDPKEILPACILCNTLASDKIFKTLEAKARYIAEKYLGRKRVERHLDRIDNLLSVAKGGFARIIDPFNESNVQENQGSRLPSLREALSQEERVGEVLRNSLPTSGSVSKKVIPRVSVPRGKCRYCSKKCEGTAICDECLNRITRRHLNKVGELGRLRNLRKYYRAKRFSAKSCKLTKLVDSITERIDYIELELKKITIRNCIICGEKFHTERPWGKFCSDSCRIQAHWKDHGRPQSTEKDL